jgi:Zn ribbon nucleic-acid-binding protein
MSIEGWKCPHCECNMLMKWVSNNEEIGKKCLNCGSFYIKNAKRQKNHAKGYGGEYEEVITKGIEDYHAFNQKWLAQISESEAEFSKQIHKLEKINFSQYETFFNLDHLLKELGCSSILELAINYHRLKVEQEWSKMATYEIDTDNYVEEIHQMFVNRWSDIGDSFLNFERV